jgi:hypothetical protein
MRLSMFPSTIAGLALVLASGTVAVPEPAAPASTTTTTTQPAHYGAKPDKTTTITLYTTVQPARGYAKTVTVTAPAITVTKTVTSAGICSSSSSTTQIKSSSTSTSISTTKQTSTTTTSESCVPTSYTFKILSPYRNSNYYISQKVYPEPIALGNTLIAVPNITDAVSWVLHPSTGRVYDAATNTLGWTTQTSSYGYIKPQTDYDLAHQPTTPDYPFVPMGCGIQATSAESVNSIEGAVGLLACQRDGNTPVDFISCSDYPFVVAQEDGTLFDVDCTVQPLVAIRTVRKC